MYHHTPRASYKIACLEELGITLDIKPDFATNSCEMKFGV
jgi:hypothetical protein